MDCLARPALIVSDNGSGLTSNAILRWAEQRGVEWHDIAPGKPAHNAFAGPGLTRKAGRW